MQSRTLWLLLIVAALVRIGALFVTPDALSADPDGYRGIAENMLEHGVFGHGQIPTAYRPPAYPLLLVPCAALGRHMRFAIDALHVVLGLATVTLTFVLARRAGMRHVPAALAAGLVAFDPILLAQSALVMSETLAALLVVLGIFLLDHCSRRPTLGRAALAGIALGAVAICRPGLLAFAALSAVVLPWIGVMGRGGKEEKGERRKKRSGEEGDGRRWRGAWRTFVGVVAGVMIFVGPWMIRNQIAIGRPKAATTHGGYTLLLGNNPFFYDHLLHGPWFEAWRAEPFHAWWRGKLLAEHLIEPDALPAQLVFRSPKAELQADALAYRHALASIRQQPSVFAWSCLVRAGHFWSPLPFRLSPDESLSRRAARYSVAAWYIVEWTLAVIGICRVFFRRHHSSRSVLSWSLLLALSLMAVHAFYWSNLRMRAPVMPLVAIAAAAGTTALRRRST